MVIEQCTDPSLDYLNWRADVRGWLESVSAESQFYAAPARRHGDRQFMNEYKLLTIADLFQKIPVDRVDRCLSELAGMINYHKHLESVVSELARTEININLEMGVTWIDDGKRDIALDVQPHPETSN